MKSLLLTLPLLSALLATTAVADEKASAPLPFVQDFQPERYLGKWFEAARLPTPIQPDDSLATAEYTAGKEPGSVIVKNTAFDKTGKKLSDIEGKAALAAGDPPGRLLVSFGPFVPETPNYHVMHVDKDYRYAVVGVPDRKAMWILAREVPVPAGTLNQLRDIGKQAGFDVGKLLIAPWDKIPQTAGPLSSWNDTAPKQAIVAFVEKVTKAGSPDFVPVPERIAVFDNDGTLWSEQPMYFQAFFIVDRIKQLAPQHPEWKTKEPFASVLKGDVKSALAGGEHALIEMAMATHAGNTTEEFEKIVTDWITTAKHPKTGKLYTEMVFQPMLELLAYLRANGFKTFIVSGGGIEFMRPWAERVYGIPPEQVIGSSIKTKYEVRDGKPVLLRLPELNFIDDKAGKPVGINQHIGRRPILAFGNSDGDFQMLEWTTSGSGPRFAGILHHTDAEREWAYDRESHIGKLDRGLDEGPKRGWTIVDMKKDWKAIFPH